VLSLPFFFFLCISFPLPLSLSVSFLFTFSFSLFLSISLSLARSLARSLAPLRLNSKRQPSLKGVSLNLIATLPTVACTCCCWGDYLYPCISFPLPLSLSVSFLFTSSFSLFLSISLSLARSLAPLRLNFKRQPSLKEVSLNLIATLPTVACTCCCWGDYLGSTIVHAHV